MPLQSLINPPPSPFQAASCVVFLFPPLFHTLFMQTALDCQLQHLQQLLQRHATTCLAALRAAQAVDVVHD
jgi:hypothetical protein